MLLALSRVVFARPGERADAIFNKEVLWHDALIAGRPEKNKTRVQASTAISRNIVNQTERPVDAKRPRYDYSDGKSCIILSDITIHYPFCY